MFIYGKEAMEISKDAALNEISTVVFEWEATEEKKVSAIEGILVLLDSLGQRFADKEENNDAT